MSFGFGVGDFITVSALALSLYRSFRNAPQEFQEISRQLESLHIVLVDLNDQARLPGSLLNRQIPSREPELNPIGKNLEATLEELKDIHQRFRQMGRISWARFELGQKDLASIRGKLALHVAALNAFMGSLAIGALGRMEPMLLRIYQLLEERAERSEVMAQTILSITSEVTDDQAWDRIRLELRTEGIPEDYLQQNERQIVEVARSVADASNLLGDDFSYGLNHDGPGPRGSISNVSSNIPHQSLPTIDMARARVAHSIPSRNGMQALPSLSTSLLTPKEPTIDAKRGRPKSRKSPAAASDTTRKHLASTRQKKHVSPSPKPWEERLTPEQERIRILLMNHGFDLRVSGWSDAKFRSQGQRAWDWAVKNNNMDAATLILGRYSHLGLSNEKAAEARKWHFVKASLLASNNRFEHKVCHLAVRYNCSDVLEVLTGRESRQNSLQWQKPLPLSSIDTSKKDNTYYCPLQIAALYGSFDAAKFLLDHGVDVDAKAAYNARDYAIYFKDHIRLMAGDWPAEKSICRRTPLQLACEDSFLTEKNQASIRKLIGLFISRGARVNPYKERYHSALYLLMKRDFLDSFKDLLEYGASLLSYTFVSVTKRGNVSIYISYLHEAARKSDHRWSFCWTDEQISTSAANIGLVMMEPLSWLLRNQRIGK